MQCDACDTIRKSRLGAGDHDRGCRESWVCKYCEYVHCAGGGSHDSQNRDITECCRCFRRVVDDRPDRTVPTA